jgi:thiosulfate/3-mercaptopyruvate sulfurtransferase
MAVDISERGYAHPEHLVSTEWVSEHLDDPNHPGVKIVECDEDVLLYDTGHIPSALKVDWVYDLNDHLRRDYLDREAFEARMRALGIEREDTLVFYGDKHNWWACYALWVFSLFGHKDLRIMDGGRAKWEAEGRPMSTVRPPVRASSYTSPERNDSVIRAFRDRVMTHVEGGGRLVDVRSPDEYSGKKLHMPDYPQEGAMRGGHIPGAASIPWARAVGEDSTFKTADELRAIYEHEAGLAPADSVIAYCRIGERSSHTWFVLHYLLGYPDVRNYDGSWTEWGNLVGVPIER